MDKTFVPIRTDVVLQNETAQLYRSYQDFLQFEHLYSSAVREIQTRLEVLNEEFSVRYDHNPIHHVESRLKSDRQHHREAAAQGPGDLDGRPPRKTSTTLPASAWSAATSTTFTAWRRCSCARATWSSSSGRITSKQPNYNGYRSAPPRPARAHLPLRPHGVSVLVEVQLRTVAMDFWASLEHDIRYKKDNAAKLPAGLNEEMLACGDEIAAIDRKMQAMYHRIQAAE